MKKGFKDIKYYTLFDNSIAMYNNKKINSNKIFETIKNSIIENRIGLLRYDNKLDLYIILYEVSSSNKYYILIKNNGKNLKEYYNLELNSLINMYEDSKNHSLKM